MQRDIIVKWFYPHPVEKVWECLTDPELLGEWFMKNDFKPVAGHKFQFRATAKPGYKWNGIVYAQVLEIVPLKKIVFSWKGGPAEGVVAMDTTVTWLLEPKHDGTELILQHKGFKGIKNYLASFMMEKGWKKSIAERFKRTLQRIADEQ